MYVIGIDPGPVAGIAVLWLSSGRPASVLTAEALQVTPGLVSTVLDALAREADNRVAVAVERFVVGPRASRSSTPAAGEVTRRMVGVIASWATYKGVFYVERAAAEVKPWATDDRLAAARLIEPTNGMRHARDAARHALFCAVKTFNLADPMSLRGRSA